MESRSGKRSRALAARIVAGLVETRPAPGAELGTEAELMARYRVSRGTLREALRQLEWQGVVRMQRGLGGGLRVARPGSYVPMFMLKVHLELAETEPRRLRQALRIVQQARSGLPEGAGNRVLALFERALDGQFVAAIPPRADHVPRLAEQVAFRLTLRIEDEDLPPGHFLGSEADLVAQMRVGRGVLREALGLMELAGTVACRRGSGGGVYVSTPSPEFTIHAASVYLALSGLPETEVAEALDALLGAAQMGLPGDARTPAQRALEAAHKSTNTVLSVLLRILAGYWKLSGT